VEDIERDEQERPRPRVVDKRVTARPPGERSEPREAPAPEAESPPRPPPHPEPPPPSQPPTREEGPSSSPPGPERQQVWTPEQEDEARRMVEEIRRVPSADWVMSSLMTLVNVASVKLEAGDLEGAQLSIDALTGILDAVGTRLGENETPLRQVATQLKMAYAQAAASATRGGPEAVT
jgi:hypothetical protein